MRRLCVGEQGVRIAEERAEMRVPLAQSRPNRPKSSAVRHPKEAKKKELPSYPAPRTTTCTVGANCGKRVASRSLGEQIGQPGLAGCITMPKMRGRRPSHMHIISLAKGQQQEQQQPDGESRGHGWGWGLV